jgi:hypothetical protein
MPLLDPQLRDLLASLRGRVRRYIVTDSLLALLALVLCAFWFGLAVDFLPVRLGGTEMPRSARKLLLAGVGVALLVILGKLLIGRLRRPLPDDSLALLVERHHPELGGRLVTAVQLNREGRDGDSHAPALLERVHAEAAEAIGGVDSNKIFRWEPIYRKAGLVVPLLTATTLFAALAPTAFGRAAGRLLLLTDSPWPRKAKLEMIGIELPSVVADESDPQPPKLVPFRDGVARLPRGSSGTLRVAAAAEGAIVPELCTAYFTTEGGSQGQANLRRVGRVTDGKQIFVLDGPPLAGLSESVSLTIRGLDARLDDFRIEAVEPPALNRLEVATTDPDYLRPQPGPDGSQEGTLTRKSDYQAGLRIREGSRAVLTAKASVPLGRVDARMLIAGSPVAAPQVSVSPDGSEFSITLDDFRRPATIIVVPEDRDGISAQVPYRYFLGVVADEQPEVEMKLKGIGSAVTPNARIPLVGAAKDDYEIATSQITLSAVATERAEAVAAAGEAAEATPAPKESAGPSVPLPVDLGREGKFETAIDLRELAAAQPPRFALREPGGAINLIAEATDRYNLDGQSHRSVSQLYRLDIVTPENLLALLERRELALRARLEQSIDETRRMRDSLVALADELKTTVPDKPAAAGEAANPAAGTPSDPPADATGDIANPGSEAKPEGTGDAADASQPLNAQNEPLNAQNETAKENETSRERQEEAPERRGQVLKLRTQQIGLQATKAAEELEGIATSLDDLLQEMANNRVDSVDRSERIGGGVRDPLRKVIAGDLAKLVTEIAAVEKTIVPEVTDPQRPDPKGADPKGADPKGDDPKGDANSGSQDGTAAAAPLAGQAVQTTEQVILQLTAILDKMLDLESYNEILDMVRELIDNQDDLIDETKKEQKRRVLDLFE